MIWPIDTTKPVKCTCCELTGMIARVMTIGERIEVGFKLRREIDRYNIAVWLSPHKEEHKHVRSSTNLVAIYIDTLEYTNGLDLMLGLL